MRSPERRYKSLWLGCLLIAMICSYAQADSGELAGIDVNAETRTVVIATKGTVGKHLARVIGRPNRLIMDFEDTEIGKAPRKLSVEKQDIHEIRVGTYKSSARVVMDFQDRPVPAFKVRRERDSVAVVFGGSLAAELDEAQRAASRHDSKVSSPLDPNFVQASAKSIGAEGKAPATTKGKSIHVSVGKAPTPVGPAGANPALGTLRPASAPAPGSMRLAQDLGRPAPSSPLSESDVRPDGSALSVSHSGKSPGGARMVHEVRPPVTPPTPDPRLVVQEITELKFIQVGHNARLVIMGGDHLDYRMNKISPTKVRIDLINAEIPKVHQKPLRTDLFSTSVEMIIPGSQNIFIQLKDSVPYQVEKKKGVLMVDFPPPRLAMTPDQKASGKQTDLTKQAAVGQARESRREAMRIIREEQILKDNESRRRTLDSLQKQQDELQKQRTEILKKQQVTPDPEIFNKPITMDFQGISLKNAFRLLAEQAGINIIVGDEVTGTTTLRLFQVPLGQVVDTVLNTHKLDREMVGNVMRIGKREEIAKHRTEQSMAFTKLLAEIDNRLAGIKQDVQKKRDEMAKAVAELEKQDTAEVPVEEVNSEEFGEAGCIDIEGESVCFYYALVKLVYAKPSDIESTLNCVFNLKCGKGVPSGVEAQQKQREEAMEPYRKQLEEQGRSTYGRTGREMLEAASRTISERQTAEAQAKMATEIGRPKVPGVAGGGGPTLDPRLAQVISNSMLWADDKSRTIFLKDTAERLAQIKKMIYSMDKPAPQVLIESRVVVANKSWGRALGIQWGGQNFQNGPYTGQRQGYWQVTGLGDATNQITAGTAPIGDPLFGTQKSPGFAVNVPVATSFGAVDTQFGFLAGNYLTQLEAAIRLGENTSQAKTISRPKVQVLDGKEAKITIGRNIAYPGLFEVTWVKAALELTVKPTIYADGRIQMDIKITDDAPAAVLNGLTSIDTRAANSVMIVKDGDTAVIGGINRTINSTSRQGWPGIMNVPLLNYLFSNKDVSKSGDDLLVFITPTIIKRPPLAS
jgi:type II secretory pathway component GspD/PulD (secretin)